MAGVMLLGPQQRSRRNALAELPPRCLLLAGLLLHGTTLPAVAQERMVPTPSKVIYPGDIIRDGMLTDVSLYDVPASDGSVIESRAALVGKVAKRTLLPGHGIVAIAIGDPKAVVNGAQVKLVYRDGDLMIVTSALALDAGGVGDTIRVRNTDSGLTISGTILPDGSVSVSGG
jgi:flagellar basal body P-ring formation protein FlgA